MVTSDVGQAGIVGLPVRPGPASELPPRVGYVKAPMAALGPAAGAGAAVSEAAASILYCRS